MPITARCGGIPIMLQQKRVSRITLLIVVVDPDTIHLQGLDIRLEFQQVTQFIGNTHLADRRQRILRWCQEEEVTDHQFPKTIHPNRADGEFTMSGLFQSIYLFLDDRHQNLLSLRIQSVYDSENHNKK